MATKRKKVETTVADEEMRNTAIWLEALDDFQDQLSDWEKGFIESITDWFVQRGKRLSPLQYEKLEKIYRKFY